MNGQEIENLLTLIDQNVASTTDQLDDEIIAYVKLHEDQVLGLLRRVGEVNVPTSMGSIRLRLDELESAAA